MLDIKNNCYGMIKVHPYVDYPHTGEEVFDNGIFINESCY